MKQLSCCLLVLTLTLLTVTGTFQFATAQTQPTLTVNPNSGPVGTIFEAKYGGFKSCTPHFTFGEEDLGSRVYFGNSSSSYFVVPDVPLDTYTIRAEDNSGYAETTFTVTAKEVKPYDTEWQQKYGDYDVSYVSNVVESKDGGYAFLDQGGQHMSMVGPASFYKVNASGEVEWKKSFGLFWKGNLAQTGDGGYVILGEWSNYGTSYNVTPTLLKINSKGDIEWVKNYSNPVGNKLFVTSDGGYAMLRSNSYLEVSPDASYKKFMISTLTKTDARGNIQWSKNFSDAGFYSSVTSIAQASDQGYILVGATSFNGTADTPNLFISLQKTDQQGNLQWKRLFGEDPNYVVENQTENNGAFYGINRRTVGDNQGVSVVQVSDGGFVASGIVYIQKENATGSISVKAYTLIVKTDANEDTLWTKTFDQYEKSPIIQTSDGGFAFASTREIIKIDANGDLEWIKDDVTFPSLGILPIRLGVSTLIENSDGSLAGIGVGSRGMSWQGNIYLFKTKPFLPLPTPTPEFIQTPATANSYLVITAAVIIAAGILIALFAVWHKKPKTIHSP